MSATAEYFQRRVCRDLVTVRCVVLRCDMDDAIVERLEFPAQRGIPFALFAKCVQLLERDARALDERIVEIAHSLRYVAQRVAKWLACYVGLIKPRPCVLAREEGLRFFIVS